MKLPLAGAVTGTVIVHEPAAGIEPPVKETIEPPLGAVGVPPQVVVAVPETVTPVGRVSVSGEVMLSAVVPALFKVMVSVEVPPATMLDGLKALPSVGGTGVPPPPPPPPPAEHVETETLLESNVTAPFCASALPARLASVVSVMLVSARILPIKSVPVPRVAELPTCQKTLHCWPPLIISTLASLAVIRVLAILNTQTELALPSALRVSVPVSPADDEKQ
jgi:hypothetical protein